MIWLSILVLAQAAANVIMPGPAAPASDRPHVAIGSVPVSALPLGGADFRSTMLAWSSSATASERPLPEQLELPVRTVHLSSQFGMRRDPLARGMHAHRGIDIPDSAGTLVRAAGSGVVAFAGWRRGYGNLVRIEHGGGAETRYAHLQAITVGTHMMLAQGAVIGSVGSTGRSTGAHLHFEVRRNGVAVDPLSSDGIDLGGRGERPEISPPPRQHWDGYGAAITSLPQSRLR